MPDDRPQIQRENLRIALAKNNFELAQEYLGIAEHDKQDERFRRGVIDAAYNAAELCAKGLISLKLDAIPSTHGGVVNRFGELYCKDGPLDREVGRRLRIALLWRNKARYDKTAEVTFEQGDEVVQLVRDLLRVLRERLKDTVRLSGWFLAETQPV